MSSVTRRMTARPSGQALHVDGRRARRAHLGEAQVAEREGGELRGLVPEDLGGGLAPVVALQQGGEVVGRAAGGEAALGAELRPRPPRRRGRAADASRRGRPRARRARSASLPRGRRPVSRTGVSGATVVLAMSADATATGGARHGDAAGVTDPWPRSAGARQRSSSWSATQPATARISPPRSAVPKPSIGQPVGERGGQAEQRRVDHQQEQPQRQHHERQRQQPQDRADDRVHDAEDQPDPEVGAVLAERPLLGFGSTSSPGSTSKSGQPVEDRREDDDLERELDHGGDASGGRYATGDLGDLTVSSAG